MKGGVKAGGSPGRGILCVMLKALTLLTVGSIYSLKEEGVDITQPAF